VSDKVTTVRKAKAEGKIHLQQATIASIKDDSIPKGNVLTTAKLAGIQAAKKNVSTHSTMSPVKLVLGRY
jgi:cyclic pyranopterin phosphate synthase